MHLFLRKTTAADGALSRPAFLCAGSMDYVEHRGERPLRITWHLHHDLPADVFHTARAAAA